MQIEDYFNFLAENDIRIKGTRIGIGNCPGRVHSRRQNSGGNRRSLPYGYTGTGLRYNPILSAKPRKGRGIFGGLSGILPKGTRRIREKSASRCCSSA